ncbi:MAG: hypothetical protein ACOYO1_17840 [Bacteroidales bacterium]
MKKQIFYIIGLFLVFTTMVACNKYFGSAMSDINKNKITSTTVSNLETAKTKGNKKVECYYQLARIYQYNQDLQNLDKAKEYYQYLISNINDANLKSQFEKLKKKQAVDRYTFESSLKTVNDLIDTRTFNTYVKTNTLDAYKEFITKYPNSNHITDAKNKAYDKACSINTLEFYKEYITKFPYHKTNDAKDKAYYVAVSINTLEVYKSFLADFQDYRKDEIHEKAFKITEGLNTIVDYNFYISTFPYSKMNNSAISKRDFIIVSDFKKSITSKTLAEQFTAIDNFLYNKSDNVQKDILTKYASSILPSISNISGFQNTYSILNKVSYKTSAISNILNEYFGNEVLSVFSVEDSYKNILSSYSYNYVSFKPVLEKRIQAYTTILSSYNLPSSTINQIKENKLNEEFVLKYYPLKIIVDNMSSYDDSKHRTNAAQIRSLLNSTIYSSCDDWSSIESFFENAKVSTSCKTCNGSGSVAEKRCQECKGRGEIRCNNCVQYSETTPGSWVSSGSTNYFTVCCTAGKLHHDNPYVDKVCLVCNGSGKKDCPTCGGSGFVTECPTCKGKGGYDSKYYDYYK